MKNDNYLKIALISTSILIALSLFPDLSHKQKISKSEPATELNPKNKNIDNIRKLLNEGKLSAKEALFYDKMY